MNAGVRAEIVRLDASTSLDDGESASGTGLELGGVIQMRRLAVTPGIRYVR